MSVKGLVIGWCVVHDAEDAGNLNERLGYCWHSFYFEQHPGLGEPCRMVDATLTYEED
jgi:hypothetical protein